MILVLTTMVSVVSVVHALVLNRLLIHNITALLRASLGYLVVRRLECHRLLLIVGLLANIFLRARLRLPSVPRDRSTHHVLAGRRAAGSGDCARVILCHGVVVWARRALVGPRVASGGKRG